MMINKINITRRVIYTYYLIDKLLTLQYFTKVILLPTRNSNHNRSKLFCLLHSAYGPCTCRWCVAVNGDIVWTRILPAANTRRLISGLLTVQTSHKHTKSSSNTELKIFFSVFPESVTKQTIFLTDFVARSPRNYEEKFKTRE